MSPFYTVLVFSKAYEKLSADTARFVMAPTSFYRHVLETALVDCGLTALP
jgi:hypothetical protein